MKRKLLTLLWLVVLINLSILNAFSQCNGNFLTANGNKLYDASGRQVRLTGVNWFGFETSMLYPHGLWARDLKSMLQQIKDQGFNCIRLPWCNKILDPSVTIQINSYGTDPYTGVTPMNALESTKTKPIEIMDIIVQWCEDHNMKLILDNHSREPDGYMNEALWYTSSVSEQKWISDWVFLADRYKNYDAVVAMDLNNEPHGNYGSGSTWGNSDPSTDWNKAAERCGNAILQANPNVLIMVEGIESYNNVTYWWGGNLTGVKDYPVQLSNQHKLVYSPHEYGPTVYPQPWFTDPGFPSNMAGIWENFFNFIYTDNTAPLLVGEFGIRDQGGADEVWFDTFLQFMGNRLSWTFWCWNPNSGDTGGLLDDQWINVVSWKMDKLRPYLAAGITNCGGSTPQNQAPIAVISANPSSGTAPLNVSFDASGSTDPDGTIISYSWNFGDGTTGSGATLLHNYSSTGNFIATLTVTDDQGATGQATITISTGNSNIPVTGVSVSPTSASVTLGGSTTLRAAVSPSDATNQHISWSSGNSNVATVNASGIVTGISAGNATITVTTQDGGFTASSAITVTSVNIPVTGVIVTPTSASVAVGGSTSLTADVSPADATNKNVSWSSGNTTIAAVNASGVVTGVAAGNATITVTTADGDYTASSAITVTGGGSGTPCDNPVTISIPFSQDGAGEYCWVTSQAIAYINSWNMQLVEVNGVDYTNVWSNSLPATLNGNYYIHYIGQFPWSHFEAPATKGAENHYLKEPVTDISIFPNPANEVFHVTSRYKMSVIDLLSVNGETVLHKTVNGNSYTLNVNGLPRGVYVMKIRTRETLIIERVIVD